MTQDSPRTLFDGKNGLLARKHLSAHIQDMRRQGGGFGFVVLLMVLAVIFYIAMNNFKSVAPTAMEIQKHNKVRRASEGVQPDSVEPKHESASASADTWTPSSPARPNLSSMDQATTDHSKSVQDTLSQAN